MSKINSVFITALSDAVVDECERIPNYEHIFSKKIESKMETLIKRRNKPYYKMINTIGKRIACFVLIVLISLSVTALAFENVRRAIADFFINVFYTHSIVETQTQYTYPETLDDIYGITYKLDGFSEDLWSDTPTSRCVDYLKDNICISFCQYTKSSFTINVNTEKSDIEEIGINKSKAIYYLDNHSYHHIIWDNGEYVFYLSSNIDKDILIKIAESVKK